MALAILSVDGVEGKKVRFKVDTGTNPWFQIRFGRAVKERSGLKFVDDLYFLAPLDRNPNAGQPLDSQTVAVLPLPDLEGKPGYAQLFSFKSQDGRAPGFSDVLDLSQEAVSVIDPAFEEVSSMSYASALAPTRRVRCMSGAQSVASQLSLEELLASAAKLAAPTLLNLLKPSEPGKGAQGLGASAPAADDLIPLLSGLLGKLLGVNLSTTKASSVNRFSAAASRGSLSHGMVADMAMLMLLGPLFQEVAKALPGVVGPVAENAPALAREISQAGPGLINAINQKQIQAKAADNKLAGDIVSELNRRQMLETLLAARTPSSNQGKSELTREDLGQLLQLLAAVQAKAPATESTASPSTIAPAASATVAASAKSLSVPSKRAMLRFVAGPDVQWHGGRRPVYRKGVPLKMAVQLQVAAPAPTSPLPKAIARLLVKDGNGAVLVDKEFRLKQISPNAALELDLSVEEAGALPIDRVLYALCQLRWPTQGGESSATGRTELVVVGDWFVKTHGSAVSEEREPRDMSRFQTFWNKVWESRAADVPQTTNGSRRVLWELDADLKYTVALTSDHADNGIMETRALLEPVDPEDIGDRSRGRMRAGIELGFAGLNALVSLWEDAGGLSAEQLNAIACPDLTAGATGEAIRNIKLRGRAGQRGLVWAIPAFMLADVTLSQVTASDAFGFVTGVTDQNARYPRPSAVRFLGLRSEDGSGEDGEDRSDADPSPTPDVAGEASNYSFDGYRVVFSHKVALIPADPAARATAPSNGQAQ